MIAPGEGPIEPQEVLVSYIEASDRARTLLTDAECALTSGLDLLAGGPEAANTELAAAGREDLAIARPALMLPIARPRDVPETFTRGFVVHTGFHTPDPRDRASGPATVPMAVTEEDLLRLKGLPRIEDYEELMALQDSHMYPAVTGDLGWGTHTAKPSFLRMLILFPKFTTGLVLAVSAPEHTDRLQQFELPAFAAYNLMSRLVDTADLSVMRGGAVNDRYLCRG